MSDAPSIRSAYVSHGVREYYQSNGDAYQNPHEPMVRAAVTDAAGVWSLDLSDVLDLACGSGEVTQALGELGVGRVSGIDPYTAAAYERRTGKLAEPFSFEQIAAGVLNGRHYSLVVCSFALHLAALSRLPMICYQLAEISPALLIVTPHKRPEILPGWGWRLVGERRVQRVRTRYYQN